MGSLLTARLLVRIQLGEPIHGILATGHFVRWLFFREGRALYYAYLLRSVSSGRFYIGSTEDFARRVAEHQRGDAHHTHKKPL